MTMCDKDDKLIEEFLKKITPKGTWDPIRKAIVIHGEPPDDSDEWEAIFQEEHLKKLENYYKEQA